VPFIFRNPTSAGTAIAAAGIFAAAVQCVFFREYLSLFSGNEFVIGAILSVWLCATGLGSYGVGWSGNGDRNVQRLALALIVLASIGVFAVRSSRLLFTPGELIGPLPVFILCIIGEGPFAFVNGSLFGVLSRTREGAPGAHNPYGAESMGALVGAVITFICVLLYAKNAAITAVAAAPVILLLLKKPHLFFLALAFITTLLVMDAASMRWKYRFPFSEAVYGREGEIVSIKNGDDVTYLLNGTVYKSTAEKPLYEQAVHVPLSARPLPRNVLVIFDKGHCRELSKYPGLAVDCIESEPRLASAGCTIAAPESFRPIKRYDAVFVGSGIPLTAATSRLYTVSFFKKMKKMMTDSGIFSFTLPLSGNYLSPSEKLMSDALKSTLSRVFTDVLIFPGNGFTFMASDKKIILGEKPRVSTAYLESTILPFVTKERIAAANAHPSGAMINTSNRPLSLLMGIALWTGLFKGTWPIVAALFSLLLFASALVLPKSKEVLSIGSTGFTVGIYSVALLLLYQSAYGLLYSRVSLLLCCLTLGFAVGTLLKRLPHADLLIGTYCVASLGLLSLFPYPSAILFYCAHAGVGILAGAQFVSMKKSPAATLYAADCVGGAFGMALTVLIIPLFGIPAAAGGLCVIKCAVWVIGARKR
jgi:spermidine synthase